MKILVQTITLALAVATLGALGTGASATVLASASTRPSITVRVDDRRILAPTRMPAGYVDIHIVTSGKVHHHLAFWHLDRGVTAQRFIRRRIGRYRRWCGFAFVRTVLRRRRPEFGASSPDR